MQRQYTRAERLERASLRAAMHIRGLWEEKGSSDTRLLEGLLLPDDLVVAGRSRAWTGAGRREHVVPRKVVIDECHRLLAEGEGDDMIAALIRDHVRIVLITREECDRLDRRDGLGLRQRMPEGWRFGDDIHARLAAAGILWDPIAPDADPLDAHGVEATL
jgi:hypothetical protein